MADGWLFRLTSTLGARQSAPTWPVRGEHAQSTDPGSAMPAMRGMVASVTPGDASGVVADDGSVEAAIVFRTPS